MGRSPSALSVTSGLLTLAAGLAICQASQLGPLLSGSAGGMPSLAQSLGAIVTAGGFGMLVRGTHRLVVNIQTIAAAASLSVSVTV